MAICRTIYGRGVMKVSKDRVLREFQSTQMKTLSITLSEPELPRVTKTWDFEETTKKAPRIHGISDIALHFEALAYIDIILQLTR